MRLLALLVCLLTPAFAAAQNASSREPYFTEPSVFAGLMDRLEKFGANDEQPRDGFYAELGHMITGGGWISAGPGYRRHVLDRRVLLDGSAAISWRAYKIAQARVEVPGLADNRLIVGGKWLWQDFTQIRYFGSGDQTRETDISDYRMKTTDLVGYATFRPRRTLALTATLGVLGRPRIDGSGGAFDRDDPDTTLVHRGDAGANLSRQPRFIHSELSVTLDTRSVPSYPERGAVARAAWFRFNDRDDNAFSFDRLETEGEYFQPVGRRLVLAGHIWGAFSRTDDDSAVPFYLLPSLGGHNTLRSYPDYRFHDRHMLVANVEGRWPLFRHVDAALFLDAGNVAAQASDLDFARRSYGAGLRVHTSRATLVRLDAARGREGWRVVLKLSDPLHLGRLHERTAPIPFVP